MSESKIQANTITNFAGTGAPDFTNGWKSEGLDAYACRAWVNFNGTGTVAIRESGNVSSITDNGTGDYTVNFTTAMPDVNYGHLIGTAGNMFASEYTPSGVSTRTTSSLRINHLSSAGSAFDSLFCSIAIVR